MDVQREVLEDVVGALHTGGLLPLCGFEEELDAGLKLGVEAAEFAVHHGDDLVVVLDAQEDVFEVRQMASERTDLHLAHRALELTFLELGPAFLEDVHPRNQQHIRQTVPDEVSQVTLVILYPALRQFQEQIGDGEALMQPAVSDHLLQLPLPSVDEIINER